MSRTPLEAIGSASQVGLPSMEGIRHVLLDIEGTICPISFVKDTLFPYALKALPTVLEAKWDEQDFKQYRSAFPDHAQASPEALRAHVEDLTKRDAKIAPLKNLQGYLWEEGYLSGAYSTPLFSDVAPRLRKWKDAGIDLAIYSSGSIFAQKLLFQHVNIAEIASSKKRTAVDVADGNNDHQAESSEPEAKRKRVAHDATKADVAEESTSRATATQSAEEQRCGINGTAVESSERTDDLRGLITDWFDTTNAGPKVEAASYNRIMAALKWPPARTLFLTDNVKEVDAATEAGLRTLLVDRVGNAPVSDVDRQRMEVVQSLEDIHLSTVFKASEGSAQGSAHETEGGSKMQKRAKVQDTPGAPLADSGLLKAGSGS